MIARWCNRYFLKGSNRDEERWCEERRRARGGNWIGWEEGRRSSRLSRTGERGGGQAEPDCRDRLDEVSVPGCPSPRLLPSLLTLAPRVCHTPDPHGRPKVKVHHQKKIARRCPLPPTSTSNLPWRKSDPTPAVAWLRTPRQTFPATGRLRKKSWSSPTRRTTSPPSHSASRDSSTTAARSRPQ